MSRAPKAPRAPRDRPAVVGAAALLALAAALTGCTAVGSDGEAPGGVALPPPVTVFGAPDRFGTLGGRLPTGQRVAQAAVPGFAVRPGQAFFFPAVASDGTLFVANMTQTISELALTGCEMVITCFHPEEATCFDEATGAPARFSNLRIPAASGSLSTPAECPNGSTSDVPKVRGAAVDDVEVVVDEHGGERVLFDSFAGSIEHPAPPDHYPMFGALWRRDGAWRVDLASLRYPKDLVAATVQGAVACKEHDCGATTEMARLPASNRIVVNQYLGGHVMVTDLEGRVLASHRVEFPRDWCDPTVKEPYVASLRQVNVDPTSSLGDERFVVVYEGWGPTGQHAQEFTYDEREPDAARRVRPVTAPFHPDSPFHPAPACGRGKTALSATYDDRGNLWLTALDRDGGWQTTALVFAKEDGRSRLERDCSFLDPTSGAPRPWGTVCPADFDVAALIRAPRPTWRFPSMFSDLVQDPVTGTMYAVLGEGEVHPIERRDGGDGNVVFVATDGLDPGVARLAPLEPTVHRRFVARGAVDPVRRALWLPVGAAVPHEGLLVPFLVGQQLEQYLYRVDLDHAFADGVAVREVAAPGSVRAGDEFVVTVRAALPGPLARRSFLALYRERSSEPLATADWTESDCDGRTCLYTASLPAAATGEPGTLAWHAGLFSGKPRAHLVGRLRVE